MKENMSTLASQPLAEVFGHVVTDHCGKARRYREHRLCPFNNKIPNCTKDKANAPLGVCSIIHEQQPVITCPIRFREDWLITEHAAAFFFPQSANWTSLTEVRLSDAAGFSAGNIDIVLAAYDECGNVYDFGALEIQAVYISGNVREPFEFYLQAPEQRAEMNWREQAKYYPRPDYLSSSRKRLAPQLIFKGGILHAWGKKTAVALQQSFYNTLPSLPQVSPEKADVAWLVYDLQPQYEKDSLKHYQVKLVDTVYTEFTTALDTITRPKAGDIQQFLHCLQSKIDQKLTAPDNKTIQNPFEAQ
jgi:hypothetical protein